MWAVKPAVIYFFLFVRVSFINRFGATSRMCISEPELAHIDWILMNRLPWTNSRKQRFVFINNWLSQKNRTLYLWMNRWTAWSILGCVVLWCESETTVIQAVDGLLVPWKVIMKTSGCSIITTGRGRISNYSARYNVNT